MELGRIYKLLFSVAIRFYIVTLRYYISYVFMRYSLQYGLFLNIAMITVKSICGLNYKYGLQI